jgi:hypothetical protein
MPETNLEQRIEAVEVAVRELQQAIEPEKSNCDWLKNVIGSMQDEPEFDKVLLYGRELTESERPPEHGEP